MTTKTMTSEPASLERVLEVTREVVDERPGYTYKTPERFGRYGCWYADEEGNPSCLVGHVIQRLDPEAFQQLVEFEEREQRSEAAISIPELIPDLKSLMTRDGWQAMQAAQNSQDEGYSWSAALCAAEDLGADAD